MDGEADVEVAVAIEPGEEALDCFARLPTLLEGVDVRTTVSLESRDEGLQSADLTNFAIQ